MQSPKENEDEYIEFSRIPSPKLYVEDSSHVYPKIHLSDEEYANAIQTLVVVCTDVVFIDRPKKTIYLARRASKPAQGWWWFIGGRSRVGEDERSSIQRCVLRETKLTISKERFEFVCMNRYFFKNRAQPPQEVGCDSLCYVFCLELTPEELNGIQLDAQEYVAGNELRAFTYADLVKDPDVTPQVLDVYLRIFPQN